MTRILYDHQNFSEQKFGGITRYFASLMDGIKLHPDFSYKLGALISDNHYIKDEKLPMENALMRPIFNTKPTRIYKWNKSYSKHLIKKGGFDVFHPTYFNPYFIKYIDKPFVLTIHDMIFEVLPEYFELNDQLPRNKKLLGERAAAFIAISESTKKDLIDVLDIAPEKIRTIHHGLDLNTRMPAEVVPNLPENYILFVGLRSNYKNFFRFLTAAAQLLSEYKDLYIVCAGGGPFKVADTLAIERLHLQKRCMQLDVSDAQLNYLYQQAMVFAFPSLYEGFGYPLLEAFRAGAPVIASNTSCFPEIGGDAVSYFDPHDVASIYKAMHHMVTDANLCSNYIQKGHERLSQFPIEKQVEQTLALYKDVAEGLYS